MTQAENIIGFFGGVRPMARQLGNIPPTTVQGWKDRGFIPSRRHAEILAIANQRGINLTPNDFFEKYTA
jgi:hypothetical protein